jgi:hypothetical protein
MAGHTHCLSHKPKPWQDACLEPSTYKHNLRKINDPFDYHTLAIPSQLNPPFAESGAFQRPHSWIGSKTCVTIAAVVRQSTDWLVS